MGRVKFVGFGLAAIGAAMTLAVDAQPVGGFAFAQAEARREGQSFADLAERLTPSVVNISSAKEARSGRVQLRPSGSSNPSVSLGSGFIISKAGLVVTNNHVIDNAVEITVTLHDGREYKANVRGRDRETDLAVLQLQHDGVTFPAVSFGDSSRARVGDWVLAIGNPFGLGGSVSQGIISARNRNIQSGQYDDYIQTDAAINRGNSGGPLFDMAGRVVGVNTAIYSQTGGSVGVGFSVPANLASSVVDQLIQYGETRRGWLGVNIDDIDTPTARKIGLATSKGALVTFVRPDSPAAAAGLVVNDFIVSFGGKAIASRKDLTHAVAQTPVGSTVPVVVVRDGARKTFRVKIDRRETRLFAAAAPTQNLQSGALRTSGLTLAKPTNEIRRAYGIADDVDGVVVTAVDPSSPAAVSLQPGDVILEIGWQRMTRPTTVVDKLTNLRALHSGPVQIYVQRGDLLFFETLEP